MPNPVVVKAVGVTAQIYGRDMNPDALFVYAEDLDGYPTDAVLSAIARCRRELRTFPAVSDVLARIDDGRPGVEEAWAMIPKDEGSSVVWTDEMRDAYSVARSLLDQDEIAARMAFRETYLKLVADARAAKRSASWSASLGIDKASRARALLDATAKGRITSDYANSLLPDAEPAPKLQIAGPASETDEELSQVDPSEMLAKIKEMVAANAPEQDGDGAA